MNFSRQLRKYREKMGLSQEELAERIYITRQTISKWENDKTYPDIHNLIALSALFDVTLDELIKGDVETMEKNIKSAAMNKLNWTMLIFILLAVVSFGPATTFLGRIGVILPFALWGIAMVVALKIEKLKKESNIKTYAEIVAFMEGKDVEVERQKRDKKKDLLFKVIIVLAFTLSSVLLAAMSMWVTSLF